MFAMDCGEMGKAGRMPGFSVFCGEGACIFTP